MKVLKLLYPEWQGFGLNNRVNRGAFALYEAFACGDEFVEIDVPIKEHLWVEGGILGRASIIKNTKRAVRCLKVEKPDKIIMIGGTCGSEMAPVSYLNKYYDHDLSIIWFDAHGDLNTPESSPSGHFHGMVLRTLLGDGDAHLLALVPCPLSAAQVTLAGVRDLDMPETEYTFKENMTIIPPDGLRGSGQLIEAVDRYESANLYIHLDLDFFNPDDFGGALFPTAGGLSMDRFVALLSDLNSRYNIVGFSAVEFASTDPEWAAKIAALFEKSGITHQFQ